MGKKLLILVFVLVPIFGIAVAGTIDSSTGADVFRINVGLKSFNSTVDVTNLIGKYDGVLIRELPQLRVLTFEIPRVEFDYMVFDANLSKLVEYIEEDYVRYIPPLKKIDIITQDEGMENILAIPNDQLYPQQWGPPCIDAERGWEVEVGNSNIIVAIVDTGIDFDHPDLIANVDTSIDWDFVNNDNNAQDDHGHGTHVAGTVAADIHNRVGVAGLQQITLMAVKGLNSAGFGNDSNLANAIIYAVDNGARVINCSWGGYQFSNTIRNAVDYAFSRGVLVVAAAGNDGISSPHYPSSYSKALGVAALDDCNNRATWSNWGSSNVYLSAPGGSIVSTYWNNTYAYLSGTSMAAPHVSGVAALYFSYNPNWQLLDVVYHMFRNADDLGDPGRDSFYGYGRVDMFPMQD